MRDAHSQRSIKNVTTTEPKVALVDLPPSSDFVILVRSADDVDEDDVHGDGDGDKVALVDLPPSSDFVILVR